MSYLDGKSYQEIAAELHRHVKSIDNALQRVKRKLNATLIIAMNPRRVLGRRWAAILRRAKGDAALAYDEQEQIEITRRKAAGFWFSCFC